AIQQWGHALYLGPVEERVAGVDVHALVDLEAEVDPHFRNHAEVVVRVVIGVRGQRQQAAGHGGRVVERAAAEDLGHLLRRTKGNLGGGGDVEPLAIELRTDAEVHAVERIAGSEVILKKELAPLADNHAGRKAGQAVGQ